MNPYLTIFNRQIPLYGMFFYLGIALAAALALLLCRKKQIAWYDVAYSGVYTMIGAVLGAKLLFLVVSMRQIITEHIPLEAVIKGGFVFYGGLLGGAAGLLIYIKQFRMQEQAIRLCHLYVTVLPLGHALGRVGCFFAGCCYGIPHDGFLSHTYHTAMGSTPLGTPLLAVQLIEAACLCLLFLLLLVVFLKSKQNSGAGILLYATLYPLMRFLLEFFRGDTERGKLLGLSTSQWVSLAILTASGIYGICRLLGSRRDTAKIDQ